MPEMEKTYDPLQVEERIYAGWLKDNAFKANPHPHKEPFCIVMPPPNITGQLHMGHALNHTIQDILTRFNRMRGREALWLPGSDHASIATEVKIVEALAAQGISKRDLGREGFLKRAWEWKDEYGGIITGQLRKLGVSCDWSRERFTMDEGCSRAVREVFVRLYEDGLIYRGNRIINWCPVCKTALSDAEVEFEERAGHLWHIRYPASDGGEGVIVATTRPETMLGDTGVAVNPGDERYKHLVGKTVRLPLRERDIPVVADEYVEMGFGTGAVKMTPAHDPNDFEVAARHNLPIDRVMHDDGTMTEACGAFAGMKALDARKAVVQALAEQGLLVKIEDYTHNVGTCYRCHQTVEPLISLQWFVSMKPLAEPAIEAVEKGETRFVPERFEKVYLNWMNNIRDWCVSRQLWWGHRIPAWYCACGETIVSREEPHTCPKCGSTELKQDEDVLDTWFSSALWPFSTLGWPDKTPELDYFYPTTVLVTAYDIIFFWVARMIFSGIKFMDGKAPFADVLMHGIVRDAEGKKMSKSAGNGMDPLEVIEQYSADALRFSLVNGVAPGGDMRVSDEKLEAARNFSNKVWNASRFALMNLEGGDDKPIDDTLLTLADKWILERLAVVSQEMSACLNDYDVGMAAQRVYDFLWSQLCDWYLELSKTALYGDNEALKVNTRRVLKYVLGETLKLLHPFMPFITEEIYGYLIPGASCMLSEWPSAAARYEADARAMDEVMDIIRAIRNLRAEMGVPPSRKARVLLKPTRAGFVDYLKEASVYFDRMASASEVLVHDGDAPRNAAAAVAAAGEAYLPLSELIDLDKERTRLTAEMQTQRALAERVAAKLSNEGFLKKAPAAVVEAEREKLRVAEEMAAALDKRIAALSEV